MPNATFQNQSKRLRCTSSCAKTADIACSEPTSKSLGSRITGDGQYAKQGDAVSARKTGGTFLIPRRRASWGRIPITESSTGSRSRQILQVLITTINHRKRKTNTPANQTPVNTCRSSMGCGVRGKIKAAESSRDSS